MITTRRHDWYSPFTAEKGRTTRLRIISPFIRSSVVAQILRDYPGCRIEVLTRFDLNDFASGVSEITALRSLLQAGAHVGGIADLHSKVFLFDDRLAVIGSANLTHKGFYSNQEFGVEVSEPTVIASTVAYFNDLWTRAAMASLDGLSRWELEIAVSAGTSPILTSSLPDYGGEPDVNQGVQYFVKFLGTKNDRVGLSFSARDELREAHCHYAIPFSSAKGRPLRYNDGDIVYISRMTQDPNDHAIFGRAIALRHVATRDVASPEERALLPWKNDWPIYIRVRDAEFIDTSLGNCPRLSQLMQELGTDSFASTMERHNRGEQNIRPQGALSQQADVRLSVIGARWMAEAFDAALLRYGAVPQVFIDSLHQGTPY